MHNEYTEVKETKRGVEKFILLGTAVLATLITALLLFVPFCLYNIESIDSPMRELLPIQAFDLLNDEASLVDGVAFLNLGLVSVLFISIVIILVLLIKCVFHLFNNERNLFIAIMKVLIAASVITGLYFVGGLITCVILHASGGTVRTASNFYPFLLMLIVDTIFAIVAGIMRKRQADLWEAQEKEATKKQKKRSNRKAIYLARAELFFLTLVITALAVLAMLSNILTVTYEALEPINISGLKLLSNYLELDEGSRLLSYILFVILVLVITTCFLSLVSFISRSKTFYKIALTTITLSLIATFLVGMFGKYYQVVQKLNEGMLSEYIKTLLAFAGINSVEYKVTSVSLYYFFGSIVVIAILLIRNPYTRGITIERELDLLQESENPHTIRGEVSLTDIPENITRRSDGSIVATDSTTGEETVWFADPCPIFTQIDEKASSFAEELEAKRLALFESPSLPKLVQFIVQYARDSRLHLSYTEEDIATFIAGLGTTKLSILQGMSGTGKTSLPKIFAEALYARCEIVEVESSWRDKNELLGYYNEFSKAYTPKKFTQALYRAKLNPDTLTFIVLDEMNLSRIEYYFSDFLSLMENEPDKRELRLVNVALFRTERGKQIPYLGLTEGHTLKIPSNVWFIGTANRDESTFEISDKVYDRAHTMNFNKRAPKVTFYNEPVPKRFLPVLNLEALFKNAKETVKFNLDSYPVIAEVESLLAPYNISFGNRIAMQIENFVSIYASCFASSDSVIQTALEKILLSKVVCKLELKSVDNKEELAAEFERLNLHKCSEFILKLNED